MGTSGREGNSSAHVPSPHRPILAPWPLRILRSSQLDALRLDVELQTLLKEQLLRSLAFFDPVSRQRASASPLHATTRTQPTDRQHTASRAWLAAGLRW